MVVDSEGVDIYTVPCRIGTIVLREDVL